MVQDYRPSRTSRSLNRAKACGNGLSRAESLSAGLSNDVKNEDDPELAREYAVHAVKLRSDLADVRARPVKKPTTTVDLDVLKLCTKLASTRVDLRTESAHRKSIRTSYVHDLGRPRKREILAHTQDYFEDDAVSFDLKDIPDTKVFVGAPIAEGSFGKVFLGLMQNDASDEVQVCALKQIDITGARERGKSLDEIFASKSVSDHPRFPTFFASQEVRDDFSGRTFLYIVMEYLEGCSLEDWLNGYLVDEKPFPELLLKRIAKQTLEGLIHLQSLGRIHRDIKPSNIVLDIHNNVKIIDFGFCIFTPLEEDYDEEFPTVSTSGTPNFLAPEVVWYSRWTPKADVWALGATLMFLIAGPWPETQDFRWNCPEDYQRNWALMYGALDDLEGPARDFIAAAMKWGHEERASAKVLLQHPWLRDSVLSAL